MLALRAAADLARTLGLTPIILGDALEGEAREVGTVHAGIARSVRAHGEPIGAPALLLSGGETTVTIGSNATGRGGRNTTFLLGLALALDGAANIWGIAGDTDGIDGMDDIAGAILAPDTLVQSAGERPRSREACSRPMTATGCSTPLAMPCALAPR